jgi:hypothetical protein
MGSIGGVYSVWKHLFEKIRYPKPPKSKIEGTFFQ